MGEEEFLKDALSWQFGISVFWVHVFHYLRRYIPWIERETDRALKVVSIVVAVLSANLVTFVIQGHSLSRVEIVPPAFAFAARLIVNGCIQHGASQMYYYGVIKRYPKQPPKFAARPSMAGPISSLPKPRP